MGSDIIIGWVAADQSATIIVSLVHVIQMYTEETTYPAI